MYVDYVCLNCGDSLEGGDGIVCEYCYAKARNDENDSEPEQISRHMHDCGTMLRVLTSSIARQLQHDGWPRTLLAIAEGLDGRWYCPRCREIITLSGLSVGH